MYVTKYKRHIIYLSIEINVINFFAIAIQFGFLYLKCKNDQRKSCLESLRFTLTCSSGHNI